MGGNPLVSWAWFKLIDKRASGSDMVVERHVNINKLVSSSGNILLEQFLIEHRKQSKIALILLYFDF